MGAKGGANVIEQQFQNVRTGCHCEPKWSVEWWQGLVVRLTIWLVISIGLVWVIKVLPESGPVRVEGPCQSGK